METFYLTGFSGTGKTMIGKLLASRKNLEFLDIDDLIEKKENMTINEIFESKSEEYFRKIENDILFHNIKQGMIISLGGGTPIYDNNREFIKKTGRVIYLRAKSQTICANLKEEYMKRPLLKNNFSIFTVEKMLNERAKYYEELANYIVDIDEKKIKNVFAEVLAIYNYANKVKCHIYIK